MSTVNAKAIFAWDADAVDWDTLTVDVMVNRTWEVSDAPQIDPLVNDAYVTTRKGTATITHEFVFYREDPALDDFLQTLNAFAVVRGIRHGVGVYDAAYVGDPFPPGAGRARSVYSKIAGFDGFDEVNFTDSSQTFDLDWQITYVKVGPDTGAPIPADDGGTETLTLDMELNIRQVLNQISWGAATVILGGGTPSYHGSYHASWPVIVDGSDSPDIQVFVHNLHTDPGDDVDFGANVNWSTDEPDPVYWNVIGWDVNGEVVTTCL